MRHMSLQMRVALLSVVALIVCTVALTVVSVYSVEGIISSSEDYWGTQYGGDDLDALPQGQENADTVITLRKFNATSVILCIFVNLLGGIAIYLIMGRALRPLTKLIEAIERIDEQKLSEQIAETGANDEVGRLTHSFNGMMARLEDAFQRQSSFTANAAHELKTPLTIMKTGVQVLLADRAATLGDYQENGQDLLDSIDRLAKIVDSLLVLAANSGPGHDTDEDVMLEPLMEAIQGELSAQLDERDMSCSVICGELSVTADPALLYRVFFNLMENACKYGKQEGSICITGSRGDDGIYVCVLDDGPGIPQEHIPYIFDAFYRVDKSRSREIGGAGLGLSIVKTMVESIGGTISAESDGGAGICFMIFFPD